MEAKRAKDERHDGSRGPKTYTHKHVSFGSDKHHGGNQDSEENYSRHSRHSRHSKSSTTTTTTTQIPVTVQ